VVGIFELLADSLTVALCAKLVKTRLDVLGTPQDRIDGINGDDAVAGGALMRTLGKICCLTARGHAHVPDGSMELWDKTCEAHDFNVILLLMTPFIKALTQPKVLLQQQLENKGIRS
jgi:hypothetical protein